MSHEIICEWLGLPAGTWPPDHYRLLGLEPGESDAELIEQRVHQRLDWVRHYQMMHPEPATEAMNRLAQAYVCLTDPASKQSYDAGLLGTGASVAVAEAPHTPSKKPDPLAWLFGPAVSVPRPASATPPPLPRLPALPPAPTQTLDPAPEPPEPVDPVIAAAQDSRSARRGLGTKCASTARVVATRRLLGLWERMGVFLESPKRRLSRSVDGPELTRLLEGVIARLRRFPRLLGAAGQPGYLVLSLAEQENGAQLPGAGRRPARRPEPRLAGRAQAAHGPPRLPPPGNRRHAEAHPAGRSLRAASAFVADQPAALFVTLLVLALVVALGRNYAAQIWQLFQQLR